MSLQEDLSYQIRSGLEFSLGDTDQDRNFQFDQGKYLPANKTLGMHASWLNICLQ